MEEKLLSAFSNAEELCSSSAGDGLSVEALGVARSLVVNPSTSDSTISSLLDTLNLSLQPPNSHSTLSHHHTLSVLSTVSLLRPNFSHRIFSSVVSTLTADSTATAAAAATLSFLLSIAERDQTLSAPLFQHTETLFLSLSFRHSISVRLWLLRNAERLRVRPSLLLAVLLGFTRDPYPYVRKASLDGLVGLCKRIVVEDRSAIEGCYFRAVALLFDFDDTVRCSAVSAVSEWGQLLALLCEENSKREWSDAIFVQLAQMVRDMNVDVRLKAFDALGTIGTVSENILLQALAKKGLEISKEKKYPGQFTSKIFGLPASSVARAFLHGLEDESYEVRRSACHSLSMLSDNSALFAGEAINLLVDMLNDDTITVRLETLEMMHHMAILDHLKVQECHMDMFLGTLLDNDPLIRSSVRNILQVIQLEYVSMFKLSVDGLLENLERYPQDEADVFFTLFEIGNRHGLFSASIIVANYDQMELFFECDTDLDSARITAFLVLAISATFSQGPASCSVPPMIFSYAVTFLGRISRSLAEVMDEKTLLVYLSHCSRSTAVPASEFIKMRGSLEPVHGLTDSLKLILARVTDIWPLIQFGCISEVFKALRSWKEELTIFTTGSKSACALVFTLQYLRVVKLLVKAWVFFIIPEKLGSCRIGDLEFLLQKLHKCLMEILYKFRGFYIEEELHILELILVSCAMRLSDIESFNHQSTLEKLNFIISRMESLQKEKSIRPSIFVVELKNVLCGIGTSLDGGAFSPFLLRKSLEFFSLKQFEFYGQFKYMHAEFNVMGSDFEKPLPFISGLPVGIQCDVTLYKILSETRLWLRMNVSGYTQFIYLDSKQFEGCEEMRKFSFIAPLYNTPKVNSFTLRLSLGMECFPKDIFSLEVACPGPKSELIYLCREQEVFFCMSKK